MEVTLKPHSQTVTHLWSIIAPRNSWAYYTTQYARVTRLSPDFRVCLATRDYDNPALCNDKLMLLAQARPRDDNHHTSYLTYFPERNFSPPITL